MKLPYITLALFLFSILLFGQGDREFFKAMRSLEGRTFYGKAIYMPDRTRANDFWGIMLSFNENLFCRWSKR